MFILHLLQTGRLKLKCESVLLDDLGKLRFVLHGTLVHGSDYGKPSLSGALSPVMEAETTSICSPNYTPRTAALQLSRFSRVHSGVEAPVCTAQSTGAEPEH
ncbi:hypothetical protein AOLI_G00314530 [Acnodon oligacanthus]